MEIMSATSITPEYARLAIDALRQSPWTCIRRLPRKKGNAMKRIRLPKTLSALYILLALGAAAFFHPTVRAASNGGSYVHVAAYGGDGMENCITTSRDNNNDTVFKNSCNQNLNVTIAGKNGQVWTPGLLRPGGTMAHDNGNGPFRWFACIPPAVAFDADNQSQWPKLDSAEYVCK
jgi:hypothetical protein